LPFVFLFGSQLRWLAPLVLHPRWPPFVPHFAVSFSLTQNPDVRLTPNLSESTVQQVPARWVLLPVVLLLMLWFSSFPFLAASSDFPFFACLPLNFDLYLDVPPRTHPTTQNHHMEGLLRAWYPPLPPTRLTAGSRSLRKQCPRRCRFLSFATSSGGHRVCCSFFFKGQHCAFLPTFHRPPSGFFC